MPDVELEDHIEERVRRAISEAKPKWYHMTVSQSFTVAIVLCGALASLGWYQSEIMTQRRDLIAYELKLADIDAHGTVASQQKTALDHQIIVAHEQRLQKLEDVNTRLTVIEARISQLINDLKDMRDRQGY